MILRLRALPWMPSMLDFDAICRGRTYFWRSLLFFDAWLWCYLSWPEVLLQVIACLRCLILMLYVVFQSTWSFYCLHSMLDSDAIHRGRTHFWRSLLFFDAWFWCYLSWPEQLLEVIACYLWCSRDLGPKSLIFLNIFLWF